MTLDRASLLLTAILSSGAFGCGGTAPPTPAEIVVSPSFRTAQTVGETAQFSAQVIDVDGNPISGATVTWSSENPNVAMVSETGLATALAQGNASIRATFQAVSGSATLVVELEPADMTKVAGDGQTASALSVLPQEPTVRVVDAVGTPISGVAVSFQIISGGGLVAPITGTTAESGEASTSWRLGEAVGVQLLKATVGALEVQFAVTATAPDLAVRTLSLDRARVSLPYSSTVEALGGEPPYAWSLSAGSLPGGMTLGADGMVVGTPAAEQTATFMVQVEDSEGATATAPLTLQVCGAPLSLSPGDAVALDPVAPGGCPPLLPAGANGDRYRVGVVRDVASASSLATSVLTVTETGAAAAPTPHRRVPPPVHAIGEPDPALAAALRTEQETQRIHEMLHEQARRLVQELGTDAVLRGDRGRGAPSPALQAGGLAPPEDRIQIRPYDFDRTSQACQTPPPNLVPALLVAFNDHLALYQDSVQGTTSPIDVEHAMAVLDYYDAYGDATIRDYFDGVRDINEDGRVVIVSSPVVGGTTAAFVWPGDFFATTECSWSNEMELIYFRDSMFHEIAGNDFQALPTLVHEMKHVSSTYRRLLADDLHPSWVEEGSAEIAAEISSRKAMEVAGDVDQGALLTRTAFPPMNIADADNYGVILRLARITRSYASPVNSLTTDPNDEHTFYGTSWHLHRFLGDAYGDAANKADGAFFTALNDTTTESGAGGFSQVTGKPVETLLEEYATAMMLNGTSAPQPARAFRTYEFTTATDIFLPSFQPPGEYPWPHTGPVSVPFESAIYRGDLAQGGLRIHDFESDGAGDGIEIAVTVTGGSARVVVVRIQ